MDRRDRSPYLLLRLSLCMRPGSVMVRASDLRLKSSRIQFRPFRFQVTTLGKLFTYVCLCHQAVQGAAMSCGWEGNRIGLASHWLYVTDFSGLSSYGLTA